MLGKAVRMMGASVRKTAVAKLVVVLLVGCAAMLLLCWYRTGTYVGMNDCVVLALYIWCQRASVPLCAGADEVRARRTRMALRAVGLALCIAALAITSFLGVFPGAGNRAMTFWAIPLTAVGCVLRFASNAFDLERGQVRT